MGYLDNTTITVDAILTKKGRELISRGEGVNISYFTLTDTGVDYTLWNPDHPSGSSHYGEAIENQPMTQASVAGEYSARNKLVTLNRETIAMPVLEISPDPRTTYLFDTRSPKIFTATLIGFNGSGLGSDTVQLLIRDSAVVSLADQKGVDISGNRKTYLPEQGFQSARLYEVSGQGPTWQFKLVPALIRNTLNASTNIVFTHVATGAQQSMNIEVNFNQDIRQTITAASTRG